MKGDKIKTLVNDSIKCECLPGYHGNDCSLPEVIWRAFIAYRQETVIHKRKGNMRRIIHMFTINHQADIPLAVIKINELYDTVDLFIVTESNRTQYGNTKPFYFKKKLDEGLCREKQDKILYTPINKGWKDSTLSQVAWEKSRKIIKNLRDDDLFIYLDSSEIPNIKALLFFKLYDGFALPFQFRMKWNVYGYFYQHPEKTKQITTGVTTQMLDDIYKSNQDTTPNGGGLVVGDLNHYGGWLCEFCYDAKVILRIIQTSEKFASLLPSRNKVMDVKYVEEFIGYGLYVDGKTALIKKSEESDTYFAPAFATQQYWKFDFLLINFYNKIDYN
ncbi:hypothetical protein RUM44_013895 [Polyplax serrata]|uniref:EGF-like domain-containing protein n=1 Tax=Polyplax serrata TaxID=468196 RepID=A0ABR1BFQ8_POLSC